MADVNLNQAVGEALDLEESMTRIIQTHGSALLRMCYVYLKDRDLAQDAVQDTFLKAFRRLHTLQDKDSEQAWLMRIAINTCKDYLRTSWFKRVDRRVQVEHLNLTAPEQSPDSTVIARS